MEREHADLVIFTAIADHFTMAGEEDEIIGDVPLLDDVQALIDLAAEGLAVKISAQEHGLDRSTEFGEGLVGRMLNIAPGEATQDRFCFGRAEPDRRHVFDHLIVLLADQFPIDWLRQNPLHLVRRGAQSITTAAGTADGQGAKAAKRLAQDLTQLADATPEERASATQGFIIPLKMDLADLREALKAQKVERASLPENLVRDWVSQDGQERIDALPKGNLNNDKTMHSFATAVLVAEPRATGQPIENLEWAKTMIYALIEAAAGASAAIAILLWIALRRFRDVLLTLVPLVAAALATLEICALTSFELNYANIIAFPVLLGVGVAFKIYYITAWREGETDFLQSALTRAVFFSAVLTGTAFGSLGLSGNPGLSSMGKLLALSLACTLASAVLFQPALMGRPRVRYSKFTGTT